MTTVAEFQFPTVFGAGTANQRFLNTTISAVGNLLGLVFKAPAGGDITGLGFRNAGITTPDSVDVRLEGVDDTNGLNSGSLAGTNTNASESISTANTWHDVTFTSSYSATKGELLAAVIEAPSGFTGNFNLSFTDRLDFAHLSFPYMIDSGGKAGGDWPCISVNYGGTYYFINNAFPITEANTININTSSDPDEVGIYFKFSVGMTVNAFWMIADRDSSNCTVTLYDSDGSTVLESVSIDTDVSVGGSNRIERHPFSGEYTLNADTWYRLTLQSDTTTSVSVNEFVCNSNAILGQILGTTDCYKTYRTDAGSWTEQNTAYPLMGLMINGVETTTGGGGTTTSNNRGLLTGGRM